MGRTYDESGVALADYTYQQICGLYIIAKRLGGYERRFVSVVSVRDEQRLRSRGSHEGVPLRTGYDYERVALVPTGVRPEFVDKLSERDVILPDGLFAGAW